LIFDIDLAFGPALAGLEFDIFFELKFVRTVSKPMDLRCY